MTVNDVTAVPKTAGSGSAAQAYPSGMKMDGPYDWVPPAYWYSDKLGGAFGFDSEMSAGVTIPLLEDVTRMLSPLEQDALWKYPKVRQYHAADSWSPFATLSEQKLPESNADASWIGWLHAHAMLRSSG